MRKFFKIQIFNWIKKNKMNGKNIGYKILDNKFIQNYEDSNIIKLMKMSYIYIYYLKICRYYI